MADLLEVTVEEDGGGDYTTVEAALDDNEQDLTSTDKYLEIKIDGAWDDPDTAIADIDGYTTSATQYIKIYTTATASHDGKWDTTAYRLVADNSSCIQQRENYVKLYGLQLGISGTITGDRRSIHFLSQTESANETWVSNFIITGHDNVSYQWLPFINSDYLILKMWNTIIYGFSAKSNSYFDQKKAGSTVIMYSCTVINTDSAEAGIRRESGTLTMKNCYVSGGSTYTAYYGTITTTTCAADDTSADIDNVAPDTDTFVNVTVGSEDFHLAADGLSPLQDAGTDTSGDSSPFDFTDDIDGDTRSGSWDIGADEYVAAGGGRTTKNTDAAPLGDRLGMSFRMRG